VSSWKAAKAPSSGDVSTPPKSQMTARIGKGRAFCPMPAGPVVRE
jgi:hypothetical protein